MKINKIKLYCTLIFTFMLLLLHPLYAEYTHLKHNALIFSKGGGFADTGSYIYTINSKGIRVANEQDVLGNYIERAPQYESRLYLVGDHLDIPNSDGSSNTAYNALIGNFNRNYLAVGETLIEARSSEDSTVDTGELKIQDNLGELWLGRVDEVNAVTPLTDEDVSVPMRIRPVSTGSEILSYVGFGEVIGTPRSAVHVFGSLRIEPPGALLGPIGLGYYNIDPPSSQSGSSWKTIKSLNISGPLVTHGAMIVGSAALQHLGSGSYFSDPTLRIKLVDITSGSDQNPEDSPGGSRSEVTSAENVGGFERNWSDKGTFAVFLPYERIYADRNYRADLQIKNSRYLNSGQAALTAITIPIQTLREANYDFPEIPNLNKEDPNKSSLANEEGNYLTRNKVAFDNGGRLNALGSDLYIVDQYGDYYPFSAPNLDVAEIHLTSILKYTGSEDDYDLSVREGSGAGIDFGVAWDRDAGTGFTNLVSSNIHQSDDSLALRLKADKTFLLDGAFNIGKSMTTINTPLPEFEDDAIALDINGSLMVEDDMLGGAFYVEIDSDDGGITDYGGGENTHQTSTFTMPEKNNYRVFVYGMLTIGHRDFGSGNFWTHEITAWMEATGITKAQTLSRHKFEDFNNFALDNQITSFYFQGVVDVSADQPLTVRIKFNGAGKNMRVYSSQIMAVGLPRS